MTVWKGPIHANYSIVRPQTPLQLPAPLKLDAGQKYLLYLTRSPISGELEIAECSRTRRLEAARDDLAVLGEGVNANDYLRLVAEEGAFPQVAIVEDGYINQYGSRSTDRVFRFPPNLEVTIEAAGPQGLKLVAFSYLSLEAGNLKRIDRMGPKHPAVLIALADGQRATFDATDGVDAPITELQIDSFRVGPDVPDVRRLMDNLIDEEPKTGVMRRIADAAGRLVGVNLVGLSHDFVLKLSWKPRGPQSEPIGSWQDGLAALNAELVADSTAPDCQDGRDIFTARLQYAHGTITAVSSSCNPGIDAFPVAELQPTDVRTEVVTYEGQRISCVQVPCRRSGCGTTTTTPGAQTSSTGSLDVCVPFKAGVASKIARLLRHVLTVLATERAPTAQ